jgi:hypothetical protein
VVLVALTILGIKLANGLKSAMTIMLKLHKMLSYLGYFAKSATFFSKVNHYAATAVLGLLDGLFDSKDDYKHHHVSSRPHCTHSLRLRPGTREVSLMRVTGPRTIGSACADV